ncbi:MAG: hypothetical protein ACRCSU_01285 [Paracoccaceae bacterium]
MIEIYRKSFDLFRNNVVQFLIIALVLETIELFMEPMQSRGGKIAAYYFLLYFFHRHFLFGEQLAAFNPSKSVNSPPMKAGLFILISLMVMAVPLGIAVTAAMNLETSPLQKGEFIGLVALFSLPLYLLSLSVFGTAMPAAVARDPRYRLWSGMKMTLSMMWRLLLGPGLCHALLLAAIFALKWAEKWTLAPLSPAPAFIEGITIRLAGFFPAVVGVAVLCHVYRMVVPAAVAPAPSAARMANA